MQLIAPDPQVLRRIQPTMNMYLKVESVPIGKTTVVAGAAGVTTATHALIRQPAICGPSSNMLIKGSALQITNQDMEFGGRKFRFCLIIMMQAFQILLPQTHLLRIVQLLLIPG